MGIKMYEVLSRTNEATQSLICTISRARPGLAAKQPSKLRHGRQIHLLKDRHEYETTVPDINCQLVWIPPAAAGNLWLWRQSEQ